MRVSKGYGSSDDGPSRTSKGMTMETLDGLKSKLFGRMTKADKSDEMEETAEQFYDDYSIYSFDPDDKKKRCRNRPDRQFVRYCQSIVYSGWFVFLVNAVVLLNIIILVLEQVKDGSKKGTLTFTETAEAASRFSFLYQLDWDKEDLEAFIKIVDSVFLSVYIVEFLLKVYCEPIEYWYSGSNKLDFFILVISILPMLLSKSMSSAASSVKVIKVTVNVKAIKVLRALRALRTIKMVWIVRGAQVIVKSIVKAQVKSLTNVFPMIVFFLMIFSILVYSTIFQSMYSKGDVSAKLEQNWGCFSACFCSLFMIMTVDGWYELVEPVDEAHGGTIMMYVNRGFIAIAVIGVNMMIFNLFIAINVLQVDEANNEYQENLMTEREALLNAKKDRILKRQCDDVKKLKDEQEARGCSFNDLVDSFKSTLKHDDYTLTENIITDLEWMENHKFVLDKLDDTTYKLQQLLFEFTNLMVYSQNEELRKRVG